MYYFQYENAKVFKNLRSKALLSNSGKKVTDFVVENFKCLAAKIKAEQIKF